MTNETRIVLVFGGPSPERDISAGSLKPWVTALVALPGVALEVVFLGRDLAAQRLPERYYYANTCADFDGLLAAESEIPEAEFEALLSAADLVVPILHGTYGEDGRFQTRLEALGANYLFSAPEGLAASYDKAESYRRLGAAGAPVPAHRVLTRGALCGGVDIGGLSAEALADRIDAAEVEALGTWVDGALQPAELGGVRRLCAVKPVRSGSSFGVSLVGPEEGALGRALGRALEYDEEVLVEQVLVGTEFSVIVFEGPDGAPIALAPTEVEAREELYDTRQKYLNGVGALLHTPMRNGGLVEGVRARAVQAFETLGMRHLARVDGFVVGERIYVTDVNGISGMGFSSFVFLQTAMVGLSHGDVVRGLVEQALARGGAARGLGAEPATGVVGRAERVHLLFGGATSERQVSRQSGIFAGLCLAAEGFEVHFHLMGTDHRFREIGLFLALHHDVEEIERLTGEPERMAAVRELALRIGGELGLGPEQAARHLEVGAAMELAGAVQDADRVFIALHGGVGEDGSVQAALDALGRPYNGCGAEASALCADKWDLIERVRARGLEGVRTPRHRLASRLDLARRVRDCATAADWNAAFDRLCAALGSTALVVKPRADGCSTGVKLIADGRTLGVFTRAIVELRDRIPAGRLGAREIQLPVPAPEDWIFEQAILDPGPASEQPPGSREWFAETRFVELTCAVVEREGRLRCATPTIALAEGSELSLDEKFQQGVGTNLLLSEFLDATQLEEVQGRVEAVAEAAGVAGYCRIDCFLDRVDRSLVLIEVNTIPGMTEATVLYPQVADAFGWSPPRLLGHLLEVADVGQASTEQRREPSK